MRVPTFKDVSKFSGINTAIFDNFLLALGTVKAHIKIRYVEQRNQNFKVYCKAWQIYFYVFS